MPAESHTGEHREETGKNGEDEEKQEQGEQEEQQEAETRHSQLQHRHQQPPKALHENRACICILPLYEWLSLGDGGIGAVETAIGHRSISGQMSSETSFTYKHYNKEASRHPRCSSIVASTALCCAVHINFLLAAVDGLPIHNV